MLTSRPSQLPMSLLGQQYTWARGQAFMPGGLRDPGTPHEPGARGKGQGWGEKQAFAELDSTLAFHQLAKKSLETS